MRLMLLALASVLVLAALQASPAGAAEPASEASAISTATQPAATYVSELGPAVAIPPRPPDALPRSGGGDGTRPVWPAAVGLALALVGILLIHTSRNLRPKLSS